MNSSKFELDNFSSKRPNQMGLGWLIGAGLVTIFLWQFTWGSYILYPFSILATWFHEMGHGLTALFLGGSFKQLVMFPNGSGYAIHSGALFLGRIGNALVAAGGPLGPAFAGGIFIMSSRRYKSAHFCLVGLGVLLLLSVLIWVRSLFGIVAISVWGLSILFIALKTPQWLQGWTIQFLGVQALVSTYHQRGYLFMNQAVIGGRGVVSDTGQIAQQLFLPYWFWAILIIGVSTLIFIQSLRIAYAD
ncbi:MAG: M50 family metallopeptidase [Oscillatoriales cyanobacterium RM2_1_1]|nr:M50 family metallopeptidase [Oscillatoriales cyanobacterium SM2_3_0]NJO45115.1 M50 family metallopeptidase [Oscillatoriales cyanobacterium RM2_1_1]